MRNIRRLNSLAAALALAALLGGCAPMYGQETPGEYVDDATITARVKTSIIDELGVGQISVETLRNVVQLSGFVDSSYTKDRAGTIARGVSGVRGVRNDLNVQ